MVKVSRYLVIFFLFNTGMLLAQRPWVHRLDSMVTASYWKSGMDTAYIARPREAWTLRVMENFSGASLAMHNSSFRASLHADYKLTYCLDLGYRGLSAGIVFNPAKLTGRYADSEWNINAYGNAMGIDFVYHHARNLEGTVTPHDGQSLDIPSNMLHQTTVHLNIYYAMNRRRFSNPAAFTHGYQQRRSCGSMLLGLSMQGHHLQIDENPQMGSLESDLRLVSIGLGAGYGYNWVLPHRWMLHLSALPTVVCYSHKRLVTDGQRRPAHYHFMESILSARFSAIHDFRHSFIGFSMVATSTDSGTDDKLYVGTSKWRLRTFYGIRF